MTPSKYKSKHDDRCRITIWLLEDELKWLKKQKERIEKTNGKKCEILTRKNYKKETEYALFYKTGYFAGVKNTKEIIWKDK